MALHSAYKIEKNSIYSARKKQNIIKSGVEMCEVTKDLTNYLITFLHFTSLSI